MIKWILKTHGGMNIAISNFDASRVLIYTITKIHQVKKTNMMDPKPAARGTSHCMTVTVRCCPIDRSSTHSSERLVRWKAFGADSLGAHQKVVVTILLRHI